jgi:hypothetical protein
MIIWTAMQIPSCSDRWNFDLWTSWSVVYGVEWRGEGVEDLTVSPSFGDGGVWNAAEGNEVIVKFADELGAEGWDLIVEFLDRLLFL